MQLWKFVTILTYALKIDLKPEGSLDPTPEQLLEEHLDLIRKLARFAARKVGLSPSEQEDLIQDVCLKLIEDDSRRLRSFKGGCSFAGFLKPAVLRLAIDVMIRKHGKFRPCAEAKKLGAAAERFDRLLNFEQLGFDLARSRLQAEGHLIEESELARWAAAFPQRKERREVSDEALESRPAGELAPDEALEAQERGRRRESLGEALAEERAKLPDDEQLVARLVGDDVPGVEIARSLGMDQRAFYPFLKRILRQLRKRLEARGFGPEDLRNILE